MKLTTEAVQTAIDILGRVPQRSGLECSEFVKVVAKDGKIRLFLSSDIVGEVEVQHGDNETFKFFVERNFFVPFVKQAKGKELTLTVDGDTMTIVDGRRRAKFKALGKDIPGYVNVARTIDGEKRMKLNEKLLQSMVFASKYATFDSMSPQLNCIYFGKNSLMSSNNYSIFTAEEAYKVSGAFPLEMVDLLKEDSTVYFHKTGARLEFPGGWIFCAVRERCRTAFPEAKIEAALSEGKKLPVVFCVKQENFKATISRLFLNVQSVANIDVGIQVEGKKGESEMKMVCEERQVTFRDVVKLIKPLDEDLKEQFLLREVHTLVKDSPDSPEPIELRTSKGKWYYFSMPTSKLQMATSKKA